MLVPASAWPAPRSPRARPPTGASAVLDIEATLAFAHDRPSAALSLALRRPAAGALDRAEPRPLDDVGDAEPLPPSTSACRDAATRSGAAPPGPRPAPDVEPRRRRGGRRAAAGARRPSRRRPARAERQAIDVHAPAPALRSRGGATRRHDDRQRDQARHASRHVLQHRQRHTTPSSDAGSSAPIVIDASDNDGRRGRRLFGSRGIGSDHGRRTRRPWSTRRRAAPPTSATCPGADVEPAAGQLRCSAQPSDASAAQRRASTGVRACASMRTVESDQRWGVGARRRRGHAARQQERLARHRRRRRRPVGWSTATASSPCTGSSVRDRGADAAPAGRGRPASRLVADALAAATGGPPGRTLGVTAAARWPSRSCRVSTPAGLPSTCTEQRVGRRRAPSIAAATGSPEPMIGSGGDMCGSSASARRPCRRTARRAAPSRDTDPTTSPAVTGGSARTTGSCETPYSRRMSIASRTVSFGWACTSDGVVAGLAAAARRRTVISPGLRRGSRSRPSTCRRRSWTGSRGRRRAAARRRRRPGRSRAATRSAATTAMPHEPPTSSPSSRASRRVISKESRVGDRDDLVADRRGRRSSARSPRRRPRRGRAGRCRRSTPSPPGRRR